MIDFSLQIPTKIDFGRDSLSHLEEEVRRYGTRVLLVYGGGSIKRIGLYDKVMTILNGLNCRVWEISGVKPNPRLGLVRDGVTLCKEQQIQLVLAVGGGSAIDTAKAIGVGVPYDGDFWDFFSKKAAEKTVPVGVVLTLSATGSEASDSSVITLEGENLKWGNIKSDIYRPVFAVMNPRYTCSLPAYQTASGATDMLSHIMERYFTPTEHVDVTDRLCEGLMKAILTAAPKALADPNDYNARADLMWAGMLAHNNLCGVGRQQDWASHQMEHELSALYDCAHGAGLAVVTPAWMTYVMDRDISRFAQFAVRVFGCEMDFHQPENTARAGVERLVAWLRSIGMPTTFAEIGAKAEDIPALVAHRAKKPGGFPFGGFTPIHESDMAAILELAAR